MKGMWRSAQGFYLQRKHFLLVLNAVRCSDLDAWCGTIKINLTQFCRRCLLLSVDSNETLYGGDPKFLSEINKLCETLIGQILDHLKTLGRDEVSHCWTPPIIITTTNADTHYGCVRNHPLVPCSLYKDFYVANHIVHS